MTSINSSKAEADADKQLTKLLDRHFRMELGLRLAPAFIRISKGDPDAWLPEMIESLLSPCADADIKMVIDDGDYNGVCTRLHMRAISMMDESFWMDGEEYFRQPLKISNDVLEFCLTASAWAVYLTPSGANPAVAATRA